jgi:hypothetical protein
VPEVVDDEVEQLRGGLGGFDVDRHPVVHPGAVEEVDLVVRAIGRPLPARVHNTARQDPIGPQQHRLLSFALGVQPSLLAPRLASVLPCSIIGHSRPLVLKSDPEAT